MALTSRVRPPWPGLLTCPAISCSLGEDPTHPAVPQQSHVLDAVRTGHHPRHQRCDFQPGVGALVPRHAQVLTGQACKPSSVGQCQHRDQPRRRQQIRIIEHRQRRRARVREFTSEMPFRVGLTGPSQVPISQHGRASRCYTALTRPTSSVDRGLSRARSRPAVRQPPGDVGIYRCAGAEPGLRLVQPNLPALGGDLSQVSKA